MEEPLFSIVIANYNHGLFLEQTIKSVLSQSFKNYELIIVDGGSTDNSLTIINKYSDKLAWWISEPDNGQSDAFNKGFQKAKGEFFFWLNADDIILENKLKIVANEIIKNRNKYFWFTANTIFLDINDKIIRCTNGMPFNRFIHFNKVNVGGPSSIFHRDIFHKVGGFDENLHYSMDTDLWMRFVKEGYKFFKINVYFWGFRIHTNSKTSSSLLGKFSSAHKKESDFIDSKHNFQTTNFRKRLQTLYKIFSGIYLKTYLDTKRLKGKKVNENP